MFARFLIGLLAAATLSTAAQAEWAFRAPAASDDLGSALVRDAQGRTLNIGCGNGGTVAISVTPDPRPASLKSIGDGAVLFFHVDGGQGLQMPATCSANGCFQDFMLGGQPWPVSQMQAITAGLRRGSSVDVRMGGQTMARFSLTGSSRALAALKSSARFCDGL